MTSHSYEVLKARHRDLREGFPQALSLRIHRSLSWLNRAEHEVSDADAKFLFLWIAFNAAYANEIHDRQRFGERKLLLGFLHRLIDSDTESLLYKAVWENFPNTIRRFIDNKYVFQPFWDYHNGQITEDDWQQRFSRSKAAAHRALGRMNTKKVIAVLFDRLYTLRNQLIHGGSTWNSGVNRDQVEDGVKIMVFVVPILIHLMMENPNQLWGDPCYPVIE